MIDHRPVIIIGAPRSGTNILRDVLVRHPACGTWPCDEINYIWRHGNRGFPTDELPAEAARPGVRRYIIQSMERQRRRQRGPIVVEKTCANSLRVPFVEAVVPNARYLFVVRDGRDVVASAMKRWQTDFDPAYVARKARFVPVTDMPYYALRFLYDRVFRRLSGTRRAASWGPRFRGMEAALERDGLEGVCAAQWAACVGASLDAFETIPASRVHWIRYEQFVANPEPTLDAVAAFLELESIDWRNLAAGVHTNSVGRGAVELAPHLASRAMPYLQPALERLGYPAELV